MTTQIDGTSGVDNVKNNIVSFAKLLATDWASSHGASGYQKLPSGLIIQWGLSATVAQNTQVVVTLPIPFPTAAYVGIAIANNTYSPSITDTALQCYVSLTQIGISKGANGGASVHDSAAYWIAIGK